MSSDEATLSPLVRRSIVVAVVVAAAFVAWLILRDLQRHPSTDDAFVDANVVRIVPQVSGPIVQLAVSDNQRVKAGDLLFEIDPRPFQLAVDSARAQLDQTGQSVSAKVDAVASAEAALDRARAALRLAEVQFQRVDPLARQGAVPQQDRDKAQAQLDGARSALRGAEAGLSQAQDQLGEEGDQNADTRLAVANLEQAQLELGYTRVLAPVDGFVTQLELRTGSYAQAGSPALSIVDDDSWRVVAFVREDQLARIEPEQRAWVHLPAYPQHTREGVVQGIGWGIERSDGNTGASGLPSVSPTVDWVRLAQRFPVRITVTSDDPARPLRRGMTASVRIDTTAGEAR